MKQPTLYSYTAHFQQQLTSTGTVWFPLNFNQKKSIIWRKILEHFHQKP